MNPKHSSLPVKTLGVLFGLFVLFLVYRAIRSELSLREYKRDFLRLEHPQGTTQVDTFGLKASYYPATYADDSIQFSSVYLVGELRDYTGDWNEIQVFYHNKTLADGGVNTLRIMVLPVEMQSHGKKIILEFSGNFSYGPSEYDMLKELKQYYESKRMPQAGTGKKLYLVYVTPDM